MVIRMEEKTLDVGGSMSAMAARLSASMAPVAAEGDYIGPDGYLTCGVCGKHKEFRRQLPFMDRPFSVRTLCDCGIAERDRMEAEERLRAERQKVAELSAYSLTDERFRESTFERCIETPDNARPLRIARNYVRNFDALRSAGKGLILYGPTGTGKTFLADCIANALMAEGVPVLVTSIIALTRSNGEELPRILRLMRSARLLVLDDYGAERHTDFKSEQIFDLIDTRYGSKKPMIITTNIPLTDLKGEPDIRRRRVNARILEVCHPVKIEGESWRTRNTREQYDSTVELLEAELED